MFDMAKTKVIKLPDPLDRTISASVRALCSGHGVKVDDLAAAIGISHATMHNRLYSKTSWTAIEVRKVADIFHVRIADLYDGLGGRFEPTDPAGRGGQDSGVSNDKLTELMQYRSLRMAA